jgi:hypothetical protein
MDGETSPIETLRESPESCSPNIWAADFAFQDSGPARKKNTVIRERREMDFFLILLLL